MFRISKSKDVLEFATSIAWKEFRAAIANLKKDEVATLHRNAFPRDCSMGRMRSLIAGAIGHFRLESDNPPKYRIRICEDSVVVVLANRKSMKSCYDITDAPQPIIVGSAALLKVGGCDVGQVKIDPEDWTRCMRYRWTMRKNGCISNGQRMLAQFIVQGKEYLRDMTKRQPKLFHKNYDRFDFRKENLVEEKHHIQAEQAGIHESVPITVNEDISIIYTKNGKRVIIDADECDRCSNYSWQEYNDYIFAGGSNGAGGVKTITLLQFIMQGSKFMKDTEPTTTKSRWSHKNGNKYDCRKSNIVRYDHGDNRKIRPRKSGLPMGVYVGNRDKYGNPITYKAYMRVGGTRRFLGSFRTIKEASEAYQSELTKHGFKVTKPNQTHKAEK